MDTQTGDRGVFAFSAFRLDPVRRVLLRNGVPVKLSARLFDTLLYLVQNHDRLVEHQELEQAVWRGRTVEEGNVSKAVTSLRRALNAEDATANLIVTVAGRGYRFAMPVAFEPEPTAILAAEAAGWSPRSANAGADVPTSPRPWWRNPAYLSVAAIGLVVAALSVLWPLRHASQEPQQAGSPQAEVAPFAPPPHSVAVMAFTNLSGDPGQEYFSDGLSEELIDVLGRIGTLRVPARTSAFSFKGKSATIGEIARLLNVGAVLEGSVRRDGSRLRITARLIDAKTGYQLWSQSYDRDQGDVLRIQGDIAAAVIRSMQVSLLDSSSANLDVGGTANAKAFNAYLRGMKLSFAGEYAASGQVALFREALAAFTEAVTLDPSYAKAHVRRALALMLLLNSDDAMDVAAIGRMQTAAQEEVERAVSLAPELPDAHALLGTVLEWFHFDFVRSLAEAERARALAPNNREANLDYAALQADLGHLQEALAAAELAASLDPLTPRTYLRLAEIQTTARHFADAQDTLRRGEVLEIAPSSSDTDDQAWLDLLQGHFAAARRTCASASDSTLIECLAIAEHALGNTGDAATWLARLRKRLGDTGAMSYAEIYAQWGQTDDALHWLEEAYRLRDTGLTSIKVDALLDPIRETVRFKDIETRMNFPP
jgi:serine/threonine-protein kinase